MDLVRIAVYGIICQIIFRVILWQLGLMSALGYQEGQSTQKQLKLASLPGLLLVFFCVFFFLFVYLVSRQEYF